jgi:hypothetical protein
MTVNADEFATQVNYLAAIGRMVVPRAFLFAERKVLFVGHGPFDPEDIALLMPDSADWHEHDEAPRDFAPDVVVLGREGFEKGAVKVALEGANTPKVIPQEGLVDELLFGHDWWTEKTGALESLAINHRGLQSARSLGALGPAGLTKPQPKKSKAKVASTVNATRNSGKGGVVSRLGRRISSPFGTLPDKTSRKKQESATRFSWPSTEAEETSGDSEGEYDLQDRSRLKELGYDTNQSPSKRWHILTTMAIPELGLPKVVSMIAWFCRSRKQQKGGRQKFARAIGEWEHDLNRLKREIYPNYRPRFVWPRSEP